MFDTTAVHPKFHHVNLKTTRLQEMIDWYGTVVGTEVVFQDATGAWLSNDAANHRVALLAFPGFADDPDKDTRTGMHHSAFEFESFDELNSNYRRLREEGITPAICIDHGMTFSYYYRDPDGNHVELQCDNFGDWATSKQWMQTSEEFHANPIGHFVDAEKVAAAAATGEPFAEIHRRAMADELAPAQAPVEIPRRGLKAMRLVTYDNGGGAEAGVLVDRQIVPVSALDAPARSVRGLLERLDAAGLLALDERAAASDERLALESVRLLAPVPDPEKIICLGLNYRDHAAETGQEPPAAPLWFAKFANSLIGSGKEIVLPAAHPDYVDYEAELAVVIGCPTHRVQADQALSHIAGAMPFNDVSARDLQLQNPLWTSDKAIDTFAPCGPALVTLDEAGDLGALGLRTRINGKLVQEGNTSNLIFSVAATVAWLSRTMTLLPGDIIATGTPAGVGGPQGIFLRAGDTVEVEVDRLGTLTNHVRAE